MKTTQTVDKVLWTLSTVIMRSATRLGCPPWRTIRRTLREKCFFARTRRDEKTDSILFRAEGTKLCEALSTV